MRSALFSTDGFEFFFGMMADGATVEGPVSVHWQLISQELRQSLQNPALHDLIDPLPITAIHRPTISTMNSISERTQ
jgi:hypothetical protein